MDVFQVWYRKALGFLKKSLIVCSGESFKNQSTQRIKNTKSLPHEDVRAEKVKYGETCHRSLKLYSGKEFNKFCLKTLRDLFLSNK